MLLTTTGFTQPDPVSEKVTPEVNAVYGFRLQSDMAFYVEAGVILNQAEFLAGIGWNNSIWLGIHKYFYNNVDYTAFSGIEVHISYPENEVLQLDPALPIGFGINTSTVTFIVESLIYPNFAGEPIVVKFAVSFLFKL
jgi:hypothetical protein